MQNNNSKLTSQQIIEKYENMAPESGGIMSKAAAYKLYKARFDLYGKKTLDIAMKDKMRRAQDIIDRTIDTEGKLFVTSVFVALVEHLNGINALIHVYEENNIDWRSEFGNAFDKLQNGLKKISKYDTSYADTFYTAALIARVADESAKQAKGDNKKLIEIMEKSVKEAAKIDPELITKAQNTDMEHALLTPTPITFDTGKTIAQTVASQSTNMVPVALGIAAAAIGVYVLNK